MQAICASDIKLHLFCTPKQQKIVQFWPRQQQVFATMKHNTLTVSTLSQGILNDAYTNEVDFRNVLPPPATKMWKKSCPFKSPLGLLCCKNAITNLVWAAPSCMFFVHANLLRLFFWSLYWEFFVVAQNAHVKPKMNIQWQYVHIFNCHFCTSKIWNGCIGSKSLQI